MRKADNLNFLEPSGQFGPVTGLVYHFLFIIDGDRGSTMVKVLCYKSEVRWFVSSSCHWNFSLTYSFRSHHGPVGDSASYRNEYQVYFLGVKCGRCVRLTTFPTSCAIVMKCGNLYFLEPSGPLQASNGTALTYLRRARCHFPQGRIMFIVPDN